ncbi:hypothetical protein ScPMuIL_004333 [Solemya velum]
MVSVWAQFKVLVWKNILLKRRNKKQLLQELLMPIYYVAILAMIKALVKPTTYPAINSLPSYSLFNKTFNNQDYSKRILVAPDTAHFQDVSMVTGQILQELYNLSAAPLFQFFSDAKAAEDAFKQEADNVTQASCSTIEMKVT